jgi:hypothetical protein
MLFARPFLHQRNDGQPLHFEARRRRDLNCWLAILLKNGMTADNARNSTCCSRISWLIRRCWNQPRMSKHFSAPAWRRPAKPHQIA